MVTDVVAQYVGDAGKVSGCRAHPKDVVIAPLNVQRMVPHQGIDDFIGMGPAVIDITDDVQVVDGQTLNEGCQGIDELAGTAGL